MYPQFQILAENVLVQIFIRGMTSHHKTITCREMCSDKHRRILAHNTTIHVKKDLFGINSEPLLDIDTKSIKKSDIKLFQLHKILVPTPNFFVNKMNFKQSLLQNKTFTVPMNHMFTEARFKGTSHLKKISTARHFMHLPSYLYQSSNNREIFQIVITPKMIVLELT